MQPIDPNKSYELLSSLFDHSGIGIAFVSKEGLFTVVNPRLCQMLGYTCDELRKKTFQDITHPDDLQADLDLLKKTISREINFYEMEKRYFHKNGSIVWIRLTVSIVFDKNNQIDHFISQIQDITETKKMEKELEELRHKESEKLEKISKNIRDYITNYPLLHNLD